MYRWTWCDARVDYRLTVDSPLHIGGGKLKTDERRAAEGKRGGQHILLKRKGTASKARGQERLVRTRKRQPDSDAELIMPISQPPGVGADADWSPYMPGSSLRGAIRSQLHGRTTRALEGRIILSKFRQDDPARLNNNDNRGEDNFDFGNVLSRHLFGTTARRGALEFSAATLRTHRSGYARYADQDLGGERFAGMRVLTHNRLDRFTMASTEGLRNTAAVDVGAVFDGSVTVRSFGWWQLGALAVAFHDACDGKMSFGARGATGLGRARIDIDRLVLRWRRDCAPALDDQAPWPGIGVLVHRYCSDGALDRVLGTFTNDGGGQMFLLDPEDRVPRPDQCTWTDSDDGFTVTAEVSGTVAQDVMRAASVRLAAIAGQISNEGAA